MAILYGPDTFTVGSDTALESYDAEGDAVWTKLLGTGALQIPAANDFVKATTTANDIVYRVTGSVIPTGYQKITATLFAQYGNVYCGLAGRANASGNAYYCTASGGTAFHLYKGSGFTDLGAFTATLPLNAATTVVMEVADNGANVDITLTVGGGAPQTKTDTSSVYTTGTPGVHIYVGSGRATLSAYIDNYQIEGTGGGATVNLTGTITLGGAVHQQGQRSWTATLTPAGAVAHLAAKLLAAAGSLTGAGALARQANTSRAGSLGPVGTMARAVLRTLAGVCTPSGAAAQLAVKLQALAGALVPDGTVGNVPSPVVGGTLTTSGGVVDFAAELNTLAGTLTTAGAVTNLSVKLTSMAGTLTTAGTLLRQTAKALAGELTPTGYRGQLFQQALAGALTLAGALATLAGKLFQVAGAVAPTGTVTQMPATYRAGTLTAAGALTKTIRLCLGWPLTGGAYRGAFFHPTGALTRQARRVLAGVLTLAGSLIATLAGLITYVRLMLPAGKRPELLDVQSSRPELLDVQSSRPELLDVQTGEDDV